jgi:hypothetical protein
MSPEKAQELMRLYNEITKDVDRYRWYETQYQDAIHESMPIWIELHEAGYRQTDDGDWYHIADNN